MRETIVSVTEAPPDSPLKINLAGVSYCDGSYYIARSGASQAVVEYIVSGSGTLIVDGQYFKPQTGDVYLIPPFSNHYYASDAETPWCKIWFNFDGSIVGSLLSAYGLKDHVLVRNCPLGELFEESLLLLQKALLPADIAAAKIIPSILAALGRFLNASDNAPDSRRMYDFIAEHQSKEHLELRQIAAISGRSVSQTIRIFKKKFGTTPYAEFLNHRMETAKNILQGTQKPVKEIALDLGFSDPYYFSRIFRKKTGMTPTGFRKQKSSIPLQRSGWEIPVNSSKESPIPAQFSVKK
ncbi:MAG: AraC family transcriptional regulator [Victivallaceae bacterium]|nr:AraC family transcriptional regulator [Victivallaceae bacterium]